METRNLDFEIPVTRQQWDQIARTAARLGPEEGGVEWREREPERIRVVLRDEDATGFWSRYVAREERYGDHDLEVAQFVFNDGRPYATLEDLPATEPPAVTERQEAAAEEKMAEWVRDKWHFLLRESGLHYERGHVPTDLPQPE